MEWIGHFRTLLRLLVATLAAPIVVVAGTVGDPAPRFELTRLVAHWANYGDPGYLPFVEAAQPEIAQVGFYGAHFWSLIHTEQYGGYPANFPVQGLKTGTDWFRSLNTALHQRRTLVVGHFNVEFLIGDLESPSGPRGFFHWYHSLWDDAIMGPKPVDDPIELLELQADGTPIVNQNYRIGGMKEYWACLRNPAWQKILKAWVRRGVELGLDGFMINYFYRHNCHCQHCDREFRRFLRDRYTSSELRNRFGIEALDSHRFDTIVSWHDPKDSSPLKRAMLQFSQVSNKAVFDDVFVSYGRTLKPDLIVGQWNHLGDFSQISGDERCLLPSQLWGRDESYLWYSTGGAANFTDLENRFPGDASLQARYIRGASGNKPFTLGKYESTRIRAAIAELAANGGTPMGFYTRFTDPNAREEIVRYYQFLSRYQALFHRNRSYRECILAYPRTAVQRGDIEAVSRFRKLGRRLLEKHVLFDILPDDRLPETSVEAVPVIRWDEDLDALSERLPDDLTRIEAPFTVHASANRPTETPLGWDLHLVNYNRSEPPKNANGTPSPGAGIHEERPIPTDPIAVSVRPPLKHQVDKIEFITPEESAPRALPWTSDDNRFHFTAPSFLVYGIVRVSYLPSERDPSPGARARPDRE